MEITISINDERFDGLDRLNKRLSTLKNELAQVPVRKLEDDMEQKLVYLAKHWDGIELYNRNEKWNLNPKRVPFVFSGNSPTEVINKAYIEATKYEGDTDS